MNPHSRHTPPNLVTKTTWSTESFKTYASILGYPDNLVDRVVQDIRLQTWLPRQLGQQSRSRHTPPYLVTQTTWSTESFKTYASKLGYPDNLVDRVVQDIGTEASNEYLLVRLISLQNMLCPKDSTLRRRRYAAYLPSYMLVQDCYYKGKERMPFWVWVKRETISSDMTAQPPHRRETPRARTYLLMNRTKDTIVPKSF